MLKKKLFAAGATIAVAAAIAAPTAAFAEYLGFTDVPADHWAAESQVIDYAVGRGVFKGYDDAHFGPDDPVTRGQVAVVMYRICVPEEYVNLFESLGGSNRPLGNTYGNVPHGMFYTDPLNWAYTNDIITGNGSWIYREVDQYGNTVQPGYAVDEGWETYKHKNNRSEPNVRPNDFVTREELAVMLARMAEHRGTYAPGKADYTDLESHPDASSVSEWAREAVAWAVTEGIMGGSEYLNPQGTATRAEASKMFEIAIEGEGFTIEGKEKIWVDGTLYTSLPYWTCTYCGAESDYGKNEIEHRPCCAIHTGGTIWIAESRTDQQMYDLGDLTGGQKQFFEGMLEHNGLLIGWCEWV